MKIKISPYLMIVLSFLALIIIGMILLFMPISTYNNERLSLIDAFFLSVSAVTVTGLSPITSLSQTLTPFGRGVILVLVQIGGLSVVTLSVFLLTIFGARISYSNRVLIRENLNQSKVSGMVKLVRRIVIATLIIEAIGILINLFIFLEHHSFIEALGYSVFHTISSFNHAGFQILDQAMFSVYQGKWYFNLSTALLIMLGSIGFIVIFDILDKRSYKKLNIHSKIVLKVNILLWVLGAVTFKISELNVSKMSFMDAFFLSVNSRTAGFNALNLGSISQISLLVIIMLMFIGGSPSSAAGGIKTTTLYTTLKQILSYATGKKSITYERYISEDSKQKAFILIMSSIIVVLLTTMSLIVFDKATLDVSLFQAVSVFSNTGFIVIEMEQISLASKIILSMVMLVGRVGMLTVLLMFNRKWHQKPIKVNYIEEKIMIG